MFTLDGLQQPREGGRSRTVSNELGEKGLCGGVHVARFVNAMWKEKGTSKGVLSSGI